MWGKGQPPPPPSPQGTQMLARSTTCIRISCALQGRLNSTASSSALREAQTLRLTLNFYHRFDVRSAMRGRPGSNAHLDRLGQDLSQLNPLFQAGLLRQIHDRVGQHISEPAAAKGGIGDDSDLTHIPQPTVSLP